MPLHSYRCEKCGLEKDEYIRYESDIPKACPGCKSKKYKRTISAHGGIKGNFGTVRKNNAGSYKRSKG